MTYKFDSKPPIVDVWRSRDDTLLLAHLSGGFSRDSILAAIARAEAGGLFRPTMDRVVVIDKSIELNMAEVDDLAAIQRRLAAFHCTQDRAVGFRAVFVAEPQLTAIALEVYAALWEIDGRVLPEFFQVHTLRTAGVIFGHRDLQREFRMRNLVGTGLSGAA